MPQPRRDNVDESAVAGWADALRGVLRPSFLAILLTVSCSRLPAPPVGSSPPPDEAGRGATWLTVFAASSLTDPFGDIGRAFEDAHPGTTVRFNFAGSRALRTQIEQGAVADVFASANSIEIEALVAAGLAAPDSRPFARNRLVVLLPRGNPAGIHTLGDLAQPGLKVVLAADEVPVGKYSRAALENLNAVWGPTFAESVLANVVSSEENVRQVVAKVALGEADAGMAYATDAGDSSLITLTIDDPYNVTAEYPMVVLRESGQPDLAEAFVVFVLSQEGQRILAGYGFLPAETP